MWKPDWLYDNMPLLYMLIGALCVWLLGPSFPTVLSLLALATASMLTISLRRDARRRKDPRSRRRRAAGR
jgi:membrane protein implicated in regulation of membrane protease activity